MNTTIYSDPYSNETKTEVYILLYETVLLHTSYMLMQYRSTRHISHKQNHRHVVCKYVYHILRPDLLYDSH